MGDNTIKIIVMSYSSKQIPIVQVMVKLTVGLRMFFVASYFETKSVDGVCCLFHILCPGRPLPTLITIWRNIKKSRDQVNMSKQKLKGFWPTTVDWLGEEGTRKQSSRRTRANQWFEFVRRNILAHFKETLEVAPVQRRVLSYLDLLVVLLWTF